MSCSFSNKRRKPMRYDHPKYWHEYAFLSSIESPENQEPTSKTRFPLSDKLPFLTSMWSALTRSSEPSHNFSPPEPQKQAHGFTISHLCQPLQHIQNNHHLVYRNMKTISEFKVIRYIKKQRKENSYTPSYFPGTKSEFDKPKTSCVLTRP